MKQIVLDIAACTQWALQTLDTSDINWDIGLSEVVGAGCFVTFLPEYVSYEKAHKFDEGGLSNPSQKRSLPSGHGFSKKEIFEDDVIKYCYDFIKLDHTFLIDELMLDASQISQEYKKSTIISNEKVLYKLGIIDDYSHFMDIFSNANLPWYFFAVGFHGDYKFVNKKVEINSENITVLVFGAYDGEGYIIWIRKGFVGSSATGLCCNAQKLSKTGKLK